MINIVTKPSEFNEFLAHAFIENVVGISFISVSDRAGLYKTMVINQGEN